MQPRRLTSLVGSVVLLALLCSNAEARAAREKVLHTFAYNRKGANPFGNLVFDPAGNLYGVTISGGGNNQSCSENWCGAVFKLAPNADGKWRETLLHAFKGGRDGAYPNGVTRDSASNLYGTTTAGGNDLCTGGCGLAFELIPTGSGEWSEKILYRFRPEGGTVPYGGLTTDSAGNLYGITESGALGFGAVFELMPTGGGKWEERVLYAFTGARDGAYASGNLIFDAAGNLYGAAYRGGDLACFAPYGCGVIFELERSGVDKWREKVLHVLTGPDGDGANGSLVFDAAGNLYGSAYQGGPADKGIIFELTPQPDGKWKRKVIHKFWGGGNGSYPNGGLVLDTAGNLYGTTDRGGKVKGDAASGYVFGGGAVFELKPIRRGNWKEVVLDDFNRDVKDGLNPEFGVTLDNAGNVFGTTFSGGVGNAGVAFEVTPQ